MLIWTARLRGKKVLLISILTVFAVIAAAALIALARSGPADKDTQLLDTAEARTAYLKELGWEIDPEPVATLQLQLSEPLAEPYLSYNKLQKEQGFDLTALTGRQLTRYTYTLKNYPDHPDGAQVNLYLCEGQVAAGDVMVTGANGFQTTLEFPE